MSDNCDHKGWLPRAKLRPLVEIKLARPIRGQDFRSENIFLPSASLFSFRQPSIQGDVFYDQEMVNRPQWFPQEDSKLNPWWTQPTRSCSRQGWALQLQTQCAWAWARGHGKVEGFSLLMVGIMILLGLQVIGCTYNVTPCKLPSIKTICWTHMLSFQLSMLIAAVEGASMLLKLRVIMLLDVRGKGAAIVNSLFKHFSTYCYMSHCPAQM